ncbi:MAG: hypothetical protein WCP74_11510 [Sphingobacteriia bacterium]|jgi:hypothetical protein
MKKIVFGILLITSTQLIAQSGMKDDVAIIQSVYGKNKKDIVGAYMKLAEPQAAAFWAVYDAYEVERKALGMKKMELINDYATNFATLSEEKADELTKAALKNNIEVEKLISKYYDKTKKVIGSVNAAKFVQLEAYLQTSVRSEIQDAIPFIGEIERSALPKKKN